MHDDLMLRIIYKWYKEFILIFPENNIMVLWRLQVCIYIYIHLILHNDYVVCIYIYMYILFCSMLKSGKWRWRVQLWPPEELHTFFVIPKRSAFTFHLEGGSAEDARVFILWDGIFCFIWEKQLVPFFAFGIIPFSRRLCFGFGGVTRKIANASLKWLKAFLGYDGG